MIQPTTPTLTKSSRATQEATVKNTANQQFQKGDRLFYQSPVSGKLEPVEVVSATSQRRPGAIEVEHKHTGLITPVDPDVLYTGWESNFAGEFNLYPYPLEWSDEAKMELPDWQNRDAGTPDAVEPEDEEAVFERYRHDY